MRTTHVNALFPCAVVKQNRRGRRGFLRKKRADLMRTLLCTMRAAARCGDNYVVSRHAVVKTTTTSRHGKMKKNGMLKQNKKALKTKTSQHASNSSSMHGMVAGMKNSNRACCSMAVCLCAHGLAGCGEAASCERRLTPLLSLLIPLLIQHIPKVKKKLLSHF